MLSHEDMVRELNEEFEEYLGDMKPHVLQLQLKSERQRCALWIKKVVIRLTSQLALSRQLCECHC